MKREETPLTPEWLRRLRDAHAEAGSQGDAARAIKARQLADKLGLQMEYRVAEPAATHWPVGGLPG